MFSGTVDGGFRGTNVLEIAASPLAGLVAASGTAAYVALDSVTLRASLFTHLTGAFTLLVHASGKALRYPSAVLAERAAGSAKAAIT